MSSSELRSYQSLLLKQRRGFCQSILACFVSIISTRSYLKVVTKVSFLFLDNTVGTTFAALIISLYVVELAHLTAAEIGPAVRADIRPADHNLECIGKRLSTFVTGK